MSNLFGSVHDRTGLLRRVGNLAQVAGIREYTYSSGRADGVRAVEVSTGPLRFEVLPGRCLDIAGMWYKGVPAGYVSKSGLRHPAYYGKTDPTGFHDAFLGGTLTTCGLHNIGPASEAAGRMHQLHGELANIPAEKVSVDERWNNDDCTFTVSGEMHYSAFYHSDLIFRRKITSRLGASCLRIEDEVENLDFAPTPCLLLYHCQFGFPFLGEMSRLLTRPESETTPHPGTPKEAVKECAAFGPPTDGAEEQCFYHTLKPDAEGFAVACLFNPLLGDNGLGAYVRFRMDTLPLLVQWKMLRSREYVCGLEPSSARLADRSPEEMAASTLQPLQKKSFVLELGVIEGEKAFSHLTA